MTLLARNENGPLLVKVFARGADGLYLAFHVSWAGTPTVPGRVDKEFCLDVHGFCRNNLHLGDVMLGWARVLSSCITDARKGGSLAQALTNNIFNSLLGAATGADFAGLVGKALAFDRESRRAEERRAVVYVPYTETTETITIDGPPVVSYAEHQMIARGLDSPACNLAGCHNPRDGARPYCSETCWKQAAATRYRVAARSENTGEVEGPNLFKARDIGDAIVRPRMIVTVHNQGDWS